MIRLDPFIGGKNYFKLSDHLISLLHSEGKYNLADVNQEVVGDNRLADHALNLCG